MGAAGDMLMSALSELFPDSEAFIRKLNEARIPKVSVEKRKAVKCGIAGTQIKVLVDGIEENEEMYNHHHHTGIFEIEKIINNLNVPENIKKAAACVYNIIAQAESKAHNKETEHIHFHEVGTMDAVCDIVGCCMLFDEIKADKIVVSPINVGKGQVKCAHGILPVPAPATAYILEGVPVYSNEITGELCTPTGAALLKHFAGSFGNMPLMKIQKTGCGMGTRDFEAANCLRVILGEAEEINTEKVIELRCSLDDMTGEQISYALSKITESGALEVFTTAIGMKKNRPGILITCLCREDKREKVLRTVFKYTSTIGIRENICTRYVLEREQTQLKTNYGNVRAKKSVGFGTEKIKAEYDDLALIADKNNVSLTDIAFKAP